MKATEPVKTRIARGALIGLVGVALLAATACGGCPQSTQTQQTPTDQQAPQDAAQAVQQMTQGLQQMAQNQTATAVDFEGLVALMPEFSGWTRSQPEGKQVSMGLSMSMAEAEYTKGDSSIGLDITDSSFNQLMLAPLSMMLMSTYSERTTTGYKKAVSIGGSPGFESWDSEAKEAEVTVVVANRFVVSARGRDVDNIDVVRSLVQAVNLAKLSALK